MFRFIPKEEKFFIIFKQMTETIVTAAEKLKEMLDIYEHPEQMQQQIKDLEHKGDTYTHDVIQKLNQSFITPIEREDIFSLATALDNVLDLIDSTAHHFVFYKVSKTTSVSKELAFVILQSAKAIDKAVVALGKNIETEAIKEYCVEINTLENEADRICREAIRDLFDNEKDPIQLIKWKEIYETLESITDRCEDVSNILETIVVKNA